MNTRGSFITKMIYDGYHPAVVASYAGNSEPIIYKHYFKVIEESDTRDKMNKTFM
ncbi:hypothetical protein [Dysgonomonas reticulitermitis]